MALPQTRSCLTYRPLGGVRTVTGSMHLIEASGKRLLLDCGMYLGSQPDRRLRNRVLPTEPKGIDAVLLTHAHIDHCGNLPRLVAQGFSGPIYCTPATQDLLRVMLLDSARVQERQALSGVPALYDHVDVEYALAQCAPIPYDTWEPLGGGLRFRFLDAGHVLGSALVQVVFDDRKSLVYTGDLGRRGMPFLHPPADIPETDLLICESTYGGRYHPTKEEMIAKLAEAFERTIEQEGKILIPAFSLGRTQIVTHFLQKWIHDGLLPRIPIFIDSPLVDQIMAVYRRHPECLTADGRAILEDEESEYITYIEDWRQSREVARMHGPLVVIASGGMLEGGRALYHLERVIDDPRCSIVLVSFQAPHTLGARLLKRGPTVSFMGRTWNKWANVVHVMGFSGHADHADFIESLAPLVTADPRIELVHGEVESSLELAQELIHLGFNQVNIPTLDAEIEV